VVDDDVRVVFLSPLLAEGPVKPGVVSGDEMAPLKNFQRFLLCRRTFREQKKGPEPAPAARAPLPVNLRKSRRESPSCFFFAILLPSKHRKTRVSSLQGRRELGRSDDATVQARESIAGGGGKINVLKEYARTPGKSSASLAVRPFVDPRAKLTSLFSARQDAAEHPARCRLSRFRT